MCVAKYETYIKFAGGHFGLFSVMWLVSMLCCLCWLKGWQFWICCWSLCRRLSCIDSIRTEEDLLTSLHSALVVCLSKNF